MLARAADARIRSPAHSSHLKCSIFSFTSRFNLFARCLNNSAAKNESSAFVEDDGLYLAWPERFDFSWKSQNRRKSQLSINFSEL